MNFYAYQRPLGKIIDCEEYRNQFVTLFDQKTKKDMVQFGLHYMEHLHRLMPVTLRQEISSGLEAMRLWLQDETNYHAARNISFEISRIAKTEPDLSLRKYYRCIAQIFAIPHVKFHGLWASDYAIVLINLLYPNDIEKVKEERILQIHLLESI